MATSKKGKKVVNQEELRRLMRAKQRQTADKKRIESPFAKYNSLDHLSCTLCNVQVKSELLWPTHVLGKQHKEKVSDLKEGKIQPLVPQTQTVKRRAPDNEEATGKKAKPGSPSGHAAPGLPGDFFEKPSSKNPTVPAAASAGLSLLAGVYDEDDEDEEDNNEQAGGNPTGEADPTAQKAEAAGLPADFFDSSIPSAPPITHSGSVLKTDVEEKKSGEKKDNTAEVLPEGFFDDPVKDAKVRNVDAPKDQMDKEWEEFQKEIRLVNTKSDAIVAEDDEEGRFERQIDEIDEQIACYKRVELLRDKRDEAKSKPSLKKDEQMETKDSVEEEDEEELLGLLSRDWRAKGVLA
ncbi:zinc finger protein 830 [Cololabis saira]|uniref:zinc finger protein 830 n=1 Tax=Cololabis saira TaxID=129043 RepID=UPI002AD37A92|nr:zinc finger protein 830 [Cololabis saira]